MKMSYYCNIVSKFEKMTIIQRGPLLKQGATNDPLLKKWPTLMFTWLSFSKAFK